VRLNYCAFHNCDHEDHDAACGRTKHARRESTKSGVKRVDVGVARSRSQVCRSPDRTRRLGAPGQLTELAGERLHRSSQCGPATEDGFATHLRQPNRELGLIGKRLRRSERCFSSIRHDELVLGVPHGQYRTG
jgi:hypothetical protein